MNGPKIAVLLLWLVLAACFFIEGSTLATFGRLAFWLLAAVHIAEFVAKRAVFEKSGGSIGHHFVQTLIYGLFHWKPLEDALAAGDGEGGSAPS